MEGSSGGPVVGGVVLALGVLPPPAAAQQMGSGGYSFPARSPSLAAQFQFQRSAASSAQGSASGLGALIQYSTVYNSSSTAIANMNSVNQNLSDGSTGTVMSISQHLVEVGTFLICLTVGLFAGPF